MRTKWSDNERQEFTEWHEKIISQYSEEIQIELRRARQKWLSKVK